LKNYATSHPDQSLLIQLSLSQMQLNKGNIPQCISILESIVPLKNKPGVISTLVALREQIGDIDGAIQTFDQYLNWFGEQKDLDQERYIKLLKESGNFKLKHSKYKEATTTFEKVLKFAPNDLEALPAIIISTSQYDLEKAEQYDKRIPPLVDEITVDAEALENLPTPSKTGKQFERTEKSDTNQQKKVEKKKKKKKRKPKKPIDPKAPPPDPERWLPLK